MNFESKSFRPKPGIEEEHVERAFDTLLKMFIQKVEEKAFPQISYIRKVESGREEDEYRKYYSAGVLGNPTVIVLREKFNADPVTSSIDLYPEMALIFQKFLKKQGWILL
jgi:hypothetical protein